MCFVRMARRGRLIIGVVEVGQSATCCFWTHAVFESANQVGEHSPRWFMFTSGFPTGWNGVLAATHIYIYTLDGDCPAAPGLLLIILSNKCPARPVDIL